MTQDKATKLAIENMGGQGGTAEIFKVSRAAIWRWLKDGVPAERCLMVEVHSGISRYDLRPDVYGPKPDSDHAAA